VKYKRNRTQSLTIRLTPAEKKMLQSRANAKHMSMTDYILLSALKQGNANNFLPVHIDRQSKNSA
jgi:uncharacterized protein (DUF1778 family)